MMSDSIFLDIQKSQYNLSGQKNDSVFSRFDFRNSAFGWLTNGVNLSS